MMHGKPLAKTLDGIGSAITCWWGIGLVTKPQIISRLFELGKEVIKRLHIGQVGLDRVDCGKRGQKNEVLIDSDLSIPSIPVLHSHRSSSHYASN